MNRYTETLSMSLPYTPEMAAIAAAIGRAMDPDAGGDKSFSRPVIGIDKDDQPIYGDTLTCSTPCRPEFKAQALVMLGNVDMLHYAVTADYAARWPDLIAPTLAECQQFVAALVIDTNLVD